MLSFQKTHSIASKQWIGMETQCSFTEVHIIVNYGYIILLMHIVGYCFKTVTQMHTVLIYYGYIKCGWNHNIHYTTSAFVSITFFTLLNKSKNIMLTFL